MTATKSYVQPSQPYPYTNPWVPNNPQDILPFLPRVPWPDIRPRRRPDVNIYTPPVVDFSPTDITVELLSNGNSVSKITHKSGTYFIAPNFLTPYTVKISNNSGCRVAVVLSIDGLSVMNGKNATQNDTAYIIDAYGSIEIKGWRRGDSEVAQFLFTEKGGSYASLTDRPSNVGVIGVIAYPEKQQAYRPASASLMSFNSRGATLSAVKTASIGTGYGANIADKVTSVSFERDYVRKVVLVYNYDSYESLVDRGIILGNPAIKQPVVPTPFPGDKVDNIFCPSPHSRW